MSGETPAVREALAVYAPEAPETERVPPGYKQTEVGVIPDDWEVRRLGDLCQIISGGTPSTAVSSFWDGTIPWCTPTDITSNNDKYLADTSRTISEEGLRHSSTVLLPSGTLLLCSRATVGEIKIAAVPVCTNQGFKSLVCSRDVNNEFLFYKLLRLKDRLLEKGTGSTFLEVSKRDVASLEIQLPGLEEQRAIAAALSDVDALISALDKLIAKKRAIKTAVMQQLLTSKTRLPGFSEKWEVKRLGDVADIRSGATPSTRVASYWNGTIPWCTPTDITGTMGKYLSATKRSITEAGLASCAASLLPVGSLLLCSRATIGEVKIAATKICTNQGFKSLVCRKGVSNEFLYYLVLTLKPQMIERAIGSTFLEIGKHDLASIPIKMPDEGEQTAIAAVLSDMDAEIEALEGRRDKTRALKQGMMQELLSGRVRLVKPSRVGAAC